MSVGKIVIAAILLGTALNAVATVPQLVRADAIEKRERCLAAGGREQGANFDGVLLREDLNGDGLLDYVLSDAKTRCDSLKTSVRERHAVKIVIGTRDGRGRLAYEGEALSARVDRSGRLPVIALRATGVACSNDLGFYAYGQQPVCWRNLVWRPYLNRFELQSIKYQSPQLLQR